MELSKRVEYITGLHVNNQEDFVFTSEAYKVSILILYIFLDNPLESLKF